MFTRLFGFSVIAAAGLALSGCMTEQQQASDGPPPVNTGLNSMMSREGTQETPLVAAPPTKAPPPTAIETLEESHPVDLAAVLDKNKPVTGDANFPPKPVAIDIDVPSSTDVPDPVAATTDPTPAPKPPADAPVVIENPGPPKSLSQKIDETSLLLLDLLRQDSATSTTPFRSAMSLAALEAVRPGATPTVITPESTDGGPLNEEQRGIVNAFRDLVAGMATVSEDELSKPDAMTEWVVGLADEFVRTRPMRINTTLAAQVTGFGQVMPMGSKFQYGKPLRAVVYTEVRRFQQRKVRDEDSAKLAEAGRTGDKWAVELTQELQLIHDVDGLKVWARKEQPIFETSRNLRHDFYLVENLTLPPTLSIGAYQLKIIVRDRTSGQEDEASIPIEIVVDPALASGVPTRTYD